MRHLQKSDYHDLVSVDSAGTHSYHIGHPPDPRAIETATAFGVQIEQLRARKVTAADFHDFDLIIAMDRHNLANLQALRPAGSTAELQLMMTYHPERHADGQIVDVPDPYYGDSDGFVHMFELLEPATAELLKDVAGRIS